MRFRSPGSQRLRRYWQHQATPLVCSSIAIMMSAAAGIPVRLYLLSGAAFQYKGLRANFLKLFPLILPLDELWTLASFRIVGEMGVGLAIATTAALLYLPFAQRRLLLIGSSAAPNKKRPG